MQKRTLLILVASLMFLAGCRSGDVPGVGNYVSVSERGESLSLPTRQALPVEGPPGGGDCHLQQDPSFELRVIELVNQARAEAGIQPLLEHQLLSEMASRHSQSMACRGFFDHQDPLIGGPENRAELIGYSYSALGENIAAGVSDSEEAVVSWLASPGHRENILGPEFTQIGIGYVFSSDSLSGHYWTLVLGKP